MRAVSGTVFANFGTAMRLLLSICLLLASVVSARAQSLTWPAPGMLMSGETIHDSQAAADSQCVESPGGCLSQALGDRVSGDDGKATTTWMTAVRATTATTADVAGLAPRSVEAGFQRAAPPPDARRAIRAFRRVLLPPDLV